MTGRSQSGIPSHLHLVGVEYSTMPTRRRPQMGIPLSPPPKAWADPIAAWLAWLAASVSPATVEQRSYQLRALALDHMGMKPWAVTTDDLAAWIAGHDWGHSAKRSHRSALRSFYGWAVATGRTTTNPAALLRQVKAAQARPRPADEDTINQALLAADDRQWLAIMLGSRQGMRRGEIARVHTRDLIRDQDGWRLRVHGKGDKQRDVHGLDPIVVLQIRDADGWAFPNGRGGHLTPAHLGKIVRRVLGDATTHMLRHRFATTAYRRTSEIRSVQEALGHASVATTQTYTAITNDALRQVFAQAS